MVQECSGSAENLTTRLVSRIAKEYKQPSLLLLGAAEQEEDNVESERGGSERVLGKRQVPYDMQSGRRVTQRSCDEEVRIQHQELQKLSTAPLHVLQPNRTEPPKLRLRIIMPGERPAKRNVLQTFTSSVSDRWFTPPWFMVEVRKVLRDISLDPASEESANRTVQATTFYTAQDNGLVLPWHGEGVYLNPPFGKNALGLSIQGLFVRKAYKEYRLGNAKELVLLVKGALGYKWFSSLLRSKPICLLYERLQFTDGSTMEACKANPLAYIGPNPLKFQRVFSKFGKCLNC